MKTAIAVFLCSVTLASAQYRTVISQADIDAATNDANLARLNVAGTIAADWVNTANPWAENEIVSTMATDAELGAYLTTNGNAAGLTNLPVAALQGSTTNYYVSANGAGLAPTWKVLPEAVSVTVNSSNYTHVGGVVTLPDYFTGTNPIALNITGNVLVDPEGSNLHFQVEFDTDTAFGSVDHAATTTVSQVAWDFWDGAQFDAFPSGGLVAAHQDADLGNVIYTWTDAPPQRTVYYVRYRSYDGAAWSDWRGRKLDR